MESRLYNDRITPRVVKLGTLTTVTVEGLDESTRFYDELEYEVKIVEQDGYGFADDFSMPPRVNTDSYRLQTTLR